MLHGTRGRVLIVDDDSEVTRTFARMLSFEGFEVRMALDGPAGLRETAAATPDAILLDLRMPLMDGLNFLRQLRAIEGDRHTPVAIITGDYFIDDSLSNQIAALDAVLCFKPLWLEDLLEITERLVRTPH